MTLLEFMISSDMRYFWVGVAIGIFIATLIEIFSNKGTSKKRDSVTTSKILPRSHKNKE